MSIVEGADEIEYIMKTENVHRVKAVRLYLARKSLQGCSVSKASSTPILEKQVSLLSPLSLV